MNRKVVIALLVSLGLNLFLLGAISARLLRPQRTPQAPPAASAQLDTPGTAGESTDPDHAPAKGERPPGKLREGKGEGPLPALEVMHRVTRAMGGPDDPRVAAFHTESMAARRALRSQMLERRAAVESALRAEPFDRARLEGSLKALQQSAQEAQDKLQTRLIQLASEMSPEERKALDQLPLERGERKRGRERDKP